MREKQSSPCKSKFVPSLRSRACSAAHALLTSRRRRASHLVHRCSCKVSASHVMPLPANAAKAGTRIRKRSKKRTYLQEQMRESILISCHFRRLSSQKLLGF